MTRQATELDRLIGGEYRHGFYTPLEIDTIGRGLGEDVIRAIAAKKDEPAFMLDSRLNTYRKWTTMSEPQWSTVQHPPIDHQVMSFCAAPRGAAQEHRRGGSRTAATLRAARRAVARAQGAGRRGRRYPLCGGRIALALRVEDGVIREVKFEGVVCAVSGASLMTEAVRGRTPAQAWELFRDFQAMLRGEEAAPPEALGKLRALAGVRGFPARVKCATLPWHALDAALRGAQETVSTE